MNLYERDYSKNKSRNERKLQDAFEKFDAINGCFGNLPTGSL